MGIRIHKVIGYGLTDVKTRGYKIADGRINRKSMLLSDEESRFDALDYFEWVKKKNEIRKDNEDYVSLNLDGMWLSPAEAQQEYSKVRNYHLCHWGSEYMMKNVLCLIPLSEHKNWFRFDDIMDYIESDGENQVKILKNGIYPYEGLMDARNGQLLKSSELNMWRFMHRNKGDYTLELDIISQQLGFADYAEANANIVPNVPAPIRDLVEYSRLFTNPDTIYQLRPMIYEYWS